MNSSSKSLNGDNPNDSTYPDLANGHASQEACYVRALYPFTSTESSSLAFETGDLIRVLTKLESGWWDGLLRGQRGWFPSNYVEEVEIVQSDDDDDDREELEDVFNKARDLAAYEQMGEASPVIGSAATIDTTGERDDSVFWIPQATNEGRVYFFNTVTGASQWDLPLSNLKHPSVSKVIKNFETPLTTNIRAPPMESPALHAREGSVEVLNDEFLQSLDGRALQRNARWSSSTSGWRDAMGNDIFAENSPISEDRESEILLFAVPENRHESPSRLGSGLVQVSSNNSDSPNIQNDTRDSSTPLASAANTRDDLASSIAETVHRETTRSKDLAQWSLRSSTILKNLSANVEAGKTEEYRASCANMRDLVSEMLQTYGLCSSGGQPVDAAEAGRAQALVKTQPEEILSMVTKLMHSGHLAGTEWSSAEEAQKMLLEATALHSTILSFNTNAIRHRPVAKLLQPTALSTRSRAAGWQGNGLANDGLHHACGLQLSSETVIDVEHYAREVQAELRICKAKLKQYGPDSVAILGSIILRDATEAIKLVRQLLSCCEQIDLSPLDPSTGGIPVRSPTTSDFAKSKQMLYDASGNLLLAAQGMTNPTETTETQVGVYDKAKVLESAITEVDDAVQATVMHVEFMVQEAVSRYTSNGASHQDAEIILESVPMNIDSRAAGTLDDNVSVKSPVLRSGSLLGSFPPTTRSPISRSTSPNANLWYLDNELDSDLSYDSKGNVKAGTLLALVERLTRHDLLDAVYNNTFLLTYRSFTSAAELSSLLRARFLLEPPQGLSPAQFEVWVQRKQNPIQLRVFNILKSWMENFFMEPPDEVTKEWLTHLKEFARTAMSLSIPSSSVLVKLIEMRIVQGDVPFRKLIPSHSGTAPNPIVPRNLKKIRLLDLDALEVARQLTLMESNLYNKIKPTECLDKSWSKPNAAEGAENIKAMILHSNQITAWVAEAILYQTDLKKRVNLIKHFVFIAEKCRVLNNFSTLTAIISGLNSAPIHRLRRTWDLLNARVAMSAEDLNRLMNSSKNFSQYREALHSTLPPCVPFLGVYLTDLTFIEDGNPNMSVKARHLINFSKRQKTADVIRDIQQYQAVPYSLQAVPEIQNYIKSCMDITRDISELYHISLEREPREREDEKIARLLQESGFL